MWPSHFQIVFCQKEGVGAPIFRVELPPPFSPLVLTLFPVHSSSCPNLRPKDTLLSPLVQIHPNSITLLSARVEHSSLSQAPPKYHGHHRSLVKKSSNRRFCLFLPLSHPSAAAQLGPSSPPSPYNGSRAFSRPWNYYEW